MHSDSQPKIDIEEFLLIVLGTLCDHAEQLRVVISNDEKGVLIQIYSAPEDWGRIIGKKGSTIQSLRNLCHVIGQKNNAHYSLKVITDNQNGNA